jgi:hypothetical protein
MLWLSGRFALVSAIEEGMSRNRPRAGSTPCARQRPPSSAATDSAASFTNTTSPHEPNIRTLHGFVRLVLREGELERDVRGLREALDPNESTLMMAA